MVPRQPALPFKQLQRWRVGRRIPCRRTSGCL